VLEQANSKIISQNQQSIAHTAAQIYQTRLDFVRHQYPNRIIPEEDLRQLKEYSQRQATTEVIASIRQREEEQKTAMAERGNILQNMMPISNANGIPNMQQIQNMQIMQQYQAQTQAQAQARAAQQQQQQQHPQYPTSQLSEQQLHQQSVMRAAAQLYETQPSALRLQYPERYSP
jgi:hypothetical protein